MTESKVLSVRISAETEARLDRIARMMKRTKSFLGAEAIEEFVAVQEWQLAGIEQAMASLDAGNGIGHDDVKSWASSLGERHPSRVRKT
ncbi:MAG TPA: CopG family ribbon-helix-helix protein [Alphaproteobacteria bacterium]|nr:CopG family ribbon-helix-helix protein [Alphaproteobacteria bacterium]